MCYQSYDIVGNFDKKKKMRKSHQHNYMVAAKVLLKRKIVAT